MINNDDNLGFDLLINKNKTGESNIKESIIKSNNLDTNLNDINNLISGDLSKKDIENINKIENNSTINNLPVNSNDISHNLDLDLDNLDNLFEEKPNHDLSEKKYVNEHVQEPAREHVQEPAREPVQEHQKTKNDIYKEKAELIRLLDRLEHKGLKSRKKFDMDFNFI